VAGRHDNLYAELTEHGPSVPDWFDPGAMMVWQCRIAAPVTGNARIDVLDMLRGIAILGIFFMNIPFMGAPLAKIFVDTRSIGWGPADQASWTAVQLLLEGTQRGLLELLFGAGMMVLTARAMRPDGPVAIADLYTRRNLWLLGFGLVDIFLLIWAGDILHIYALAALFLFPFRKLGPKLLLTLGLGWAMLWAVGIPEHGLRQYVDRAELVQQADTAHAHQRAGRGADLGGRQGAGGLEQAESPRIYPTPSCARGSPRR
jgi:uncharacterized protein